MVPVTIDLTDVVNEFSLDKKISEDLREFVVKESIAAVAKRWDDEAKNNLRQSREEYRRGLVVVESGRFEGMIVLNGVVPNMVEQGAAPFNMKEGYAKSAKKHITKDGGWYLSIPFRYGVPTTLGDSSVFSGIMSPEVYNQVKKEGKITKSNLPESSNIPRVRKAVTIKSKTFEAYASKSSVFLGIAKNSKQYEGANQNTYSSFRRVSSKSDEGVFIHPGITARNFAEKALEKADLNSLVPQLVDQFMKGIF